jgi:hypothetical protein
MTGPKFKDIMAVSKTAIKKFREHEAGDLDPLGRPAHGREIMAERLAVRTRDLRREADWALDRAKAERTRLRLAADAEYDDPLRALDRSELEEAFYRREFVKEEAATMPPLALIRRLKGVAADGLGMGLPDRVSCLLWSRYARERLEKEAERRAAAGQSQAVGADPLLDEIATLADRLAGEIAPKGIMPASEARRQLAAVEEFERSVQRELREADGTAERERATMAASARYSM